jgi:peptide/nickel transport system ATP-binding protein
MSMHDIVQPADGSPDVPLIEVRDLRRHFGTRDRPVRAVDGVSFAIRRGETLGLVGESGSGKSTIGRTVLRLLDCTGGQVLYRGEDIAALSGARMRRLRSRLQIIFQDPYASLNPKMRIGAALGEALSTHGLHQGPGQPERRIAELLDMVGLRAEHAARFPHEFSGGQRQRIGIARALAVEPEFIVADEPLSALDVSIQAQVINLLADLRERLSLTMLFISHDLDVVEYLCDRVVVLYLGRVMEIAPTAELFARPLHPYTRALLAASPKPDPTDDLLDPMIGPGFKGFPHGHAPLRRSASPAGWNRRRPRRAQARRARAQRGLAAGLRARVGLDLAPHGKTTMSPQLFRRQLDAGAWGITFATVFQLRGRRGRRGAACADRQPGADRRRLAGWPAAAARPCRPACGLPRRLRRTAATRSRPGRRHARRPGVRGAARTGRARRAHRLPHARRGAGAGAAAARQRVGAVGRHRVLRGPGRHGRQRHRRALRDGADGPRGSARTRMRPPRPVRRRRGARSRPAARRSSTWWPRA